MDFGNAIGSVQGGIRPALVTQNDKGNYFSPTLQVAPITTKGKTKLPTHLELDTSCGLAYPSTVLFEQSRVIDKREQVKGKIIGHIEMSKFIEVKILIAFGCLNFLGESFKRVVSL